jgi:hypothetical protein
MHWFGMFQNGVGTMLSDNKMGLDWTGLGQGNMFVVRLFIMRTSGEERLIV